MRPRKLSISHVLLALLMIDICMRLSTTFIVSNTAIMAQNEPPSSSSLPPMDLPYNTSTVFINIGSNLDPFLPPAEYGDEAVTIAFEPIVGCKIIPHKQLMVVHAAVAATPGLTSMYVYNNNGESSSLSKVAIKSFWNSGKNDGKVHVVPLLTLQQIIQAIPPHVQIPYIKTDMQGHDFAAVSAAGTNLFKRGVDYLFTEVYFNDEASYKGVHNDLCRDWWPYMQTVGYELVYLDKHEFFAVKQNATAAADFCEEQKSRRKSTTMNTFILAEADVLWKRKGAADKEFNFQSLQQTLVAGKRTNMGI